MISKITVTVHSVNREYIRSCELKHSSEQIKEY